MLVLVRAKVARYKDGRARFAGKTGEVRRPPAGRHLVDATDPLLPGDHVEHAYTVHFEDGDEALFLSHELECNDTTLPKFREAEGDIFGGREGASAGDHAEVTEVTE